MTQSEWCKWGSVVPDNWQDQTWQGARPWLLPAPRGFLDGRGAFFLAAAGCGAEGPCTSPCSWPAPLSYTSRMVSRPRSSSCAEATPLEYQDL